MSGTLRGLPSVDRLVQSTPGLDQFPRRLVVEEARRVIEKARSQIAAGGSVSQNLGTQLTHSLESLRRPSLCRVINATGVILHTNLGRAPLLPGIDPGAYSNLEYDLETGKRGKRDAHVSPLLERLLGHPGIAVNNGAAAVWLILREFAAGYEVIVSRGELIEIGEGFRIPDIMAESGAKLVEVGTTNKTRVDDYRNAITERTRLILTVHPSNFTIEGFAGRPSISELAALSAERGIPLYQDLGSGSLWDLAAWGIEEPTVAASLQAGAGLVSFSGDKLLGGPQAGIIVGRSDLVDRVRRNSMYRALRLDKLAISALAAALRAAILEDWDRIPALQMIRHPLEQLHERAQKLAARCEGTVVEGESVIGGGSTPAQTLRSWLVSLPGSAVDLEAALRKSTPPVIARIERDQVWIDVRTVSREDDDLLARLVQSALRT